MVGWRFSNLPWEVLRDTLNWGHKELYVISIYHGPFLHNKHKTIAGSLLMSRQLTSWQANVTLLLLTFAWRPTCWAKRRDLYSSFGHEHETKCMLILLIICSMIKQAAFHREFVMLKCKREYNFFLFLMQRVFWILYLKQLISTVYNTIFCSFWFWLSRDPLQLIMWHFSMFKPYLTLLRRNLGMNVSQEVNQVVH